MPLQQCSYKCSEFKILLVVYRGRTPHPISTYPLLPNHGCTALPLLQNPGSNTIHEWGFMKCAPTLHLDGLLNSFFAFQFLSDFCVFLLFFLIVIFVCALEQSILCQLLILCMCGCGCMCMYVCMCVHNYARVGVCVLDCSKQLSRNTLLPCRPMRWVLVINRCSIKPYKATVFGASTALVANYVASRLFGKIHSCSDSALWPITFSCV